MGDKMKQLITNATIFYNSQFVKKDISFELLRDGDGNITGTKNILGNYGERTILIDVVDTTAPGFNELLNRYNVGTDCRVELGNMIGGSADQDMDMILDCYGVTTTAGEPPVTSYNFEDNVFTSSFVSLFTSKRVILSQNISYLSSASLINACSLLSFSCIAKLLNSKEVIIELLNFS